MQGQRDLRLHESPQALVVVGCMSTQGLGGLGSPQRNLRMKGIRDQPHGHRDLTLSSAIGGRRLSIECIAEGGPGMAACAPCGKATGKVGW